MVLSPLPFRTVLKVADTGYPTTTSEKKVMVEHHDNEDDDKKDEEPLQRTFTDHLAEQRRQQLQAANGMQRRRDGTTSIIGGDMKLLSKDKEGDNMKLLLLQDTLLSPEATKFLEDNGRDWCCPAHRVQICSEVLLCVC
jgi:hypothetical protein